MVSIYPSNFAGGGEENGSWLKRMGDVKEHADDGCAAPCAKCHVWNRVCVYTTRGEPCVDAAMKTQTTLKQLAPLLCAFAQPSDLGQLKKQ